MKKNEILHTLHLIGIIPAIVVEHVEDAAPLAHALIKGKIRAAEVTFRTNCAKEVIQEMKKAEPELIVGAGTVLTENQVKEALEAGSEFIVAPGFNPGIASLCKDIPYIPGVATASEIEGALSFGIHIMKFFPAEQMGGIKTIKALCGPYRNVTFLPTGGISQNNFLTYVNDEKIFAVGGTWMVKNSYIENKQFETIEKLCYQAVEQMLHVQLKNTSWKNLDRLKTAACITLTASNLERVIYYYQKEGCEFDTESFIKDENGTILAVENAAHTLRFERG